MDKFIESLLNNPQYDETKKEMFGNVPVFSGSRPNYVNNATDFCVEYADTVGVGIAGSNVPLEPSRSPTWMDLDNNIRSKSDCNCQPIGNPERQQDGSGVLLQNWYVNETDRGNISPQTVEQLNLSGQTQWNNLSFLDHQKTTTKETTSFAYAGNAQRENDGTEFYTYSDLPKTSIRQTTSFAYAGNAQRESDGTEFYTYSDLPKTTTKETTDYSYAGILGNSGSVNVPTNYSQYTGYNGGSGDSPNGGIIGFNNKVQSRVGGADTATIRGSTLIENWVAPAGRQNILQDPDELLGKINFGIKYDENYNGPGTIRQALPDGARFQFMNYMAVPHANANKLIAVDDRQTAGYQVNQLQNNPLSIYTVEPKGEIPSFFAHMEPDDYSTMVNIPADNLRQPSSDGTIEGSGIESGKVVQVYPVQSSPNRIIEKEGFHNKYSVMGMIDNKNKNIISNPNSDLIYNMSTDDNNSVNSFIYQKQKPNNNPSFTGKTYSGPLNLEQKITIGGKNEPNVYGNLTNTSSADVPYYAGMAQGINNPQLQSKQNSIQNEMGQIPVCDGNKALNFATNTLFLENVK
jgi:hypothetical protein